MGLLLHLGRTLDELDAPRWPAPPADATHLIRMVHELRRVPLRELRPADVRMVIAQYEGDRLLTTVRARTTAWCRASRPDSAQPLSALPEAALAALPRGTTEEIARFVAGAESPR